MLGNPTEVVLVRMCADGVKPPAERYRYPNALAGMVRIGQEEGLKAFYKGLGPNVIRSVLMSVFLLTELGVFADREKMSPRLLFILLQKAGCCRIKSFLSQTVFQHISSPR